MKTIDPTVYTHRENQFRLYRCDIGPYQRWAVLIFAGPLAGPKGFVCPELAETPAEAERQANAIIDHCMDEMAKGKIWAWLRPVVKS